MFDYRSIHAAAVDKVAALERETAERRTRQVARSASHERARPASNLFRTLGFLMA